MPHLQTAASPALDARQLGHILAVYDGLPETILSVEHALLLARRIQASVFILGLPLSLDRDTDAPAVRAEMVDELIAYIHAGRRLGLDVDAQCPDEVSHRSVERFIADLHIDQVVVPKVGAHTRPGTAALVRDLVQSCTVPLVICEDAPPEAAP